MNIDLLRHLYISNKRTNNLVSIDKVHGNELPNNIDVMTYSFPCQDLSNVGAFHGYKSGIDKNKKSRSGLLWEVERIMYERFESGRKLPRILLMENVSTLLSPRHNNNFQQWIKSLEKLGYYSVYHTLNAKDFGIPKNRERIFMISIFIDNMDDSTINKCKKIIDKKFEKKIPMSSLDDFLKTNYVGEYLYEALEAQPNNTESRQKIYNENYYLFGDNPNREQADFCRTITTRQDRHPNAGVIDFDGPRNNYRFLTSRETFLLMGFTELDYESVIKDNFFRDRSNKYFSRDKFYVLAGNSIVVNVLEEIFRRIYEVYLIMNQLEH